ncbi:MAG: PAS domain S-box protein [Opitutaceae bacterium]
MAELPSLPRLGRAARAVMWLGVLAATAVALWGVVVWAAVAAGLLEAAQAVGHVPPITAVTLAIVGSALIVLLGAHRRPIPRKIAAGLAVCAALIAGCCSIAGWSGRPFFMEERLLTLLRLDADQTMVRMSRHSAVLVIIATFALLVRLTPLASGLGLRIASGVGVTLGALHATGVLLGYLLSTPLFHLGGAAPMAWPSAVALWAINVSLFVPVLHEYLAARDAGRLPGNHGRTARDWRRLLTIVGSTALLIVIAFVGILRVQLRSLERTALNELATISDLKADQLAAWYVERQRDVRFIAQSPVLLREVPRLFAEPAAPEAQRELRALLEAIRGNHQYSRIVVFDAATVSRLSIPDTAPPDPKLLSVVREAIVHPTSPQGTIHGDLGDPRATMDMVAAFTSETGRALGAIAIRMDAHTALQRIVRAWPVPSTTAETLLVQRDDGERDSLGQIVLQAAGMHRLQLTRRTDFASGATGSAPLEIYYGQDARGANVVAAVRLVPGTPWGMIAKINEAEVVASMHGQVTLIGFTGLALICIVVAGGEMLWRRQTAVGLAKEIAAERRHREVAERLALITRYANDIILLADLDGRLVEANERAVSAYGYAREELLALRQVDLRAPEARPALAVDTRLSDTNDGRVFETWHRRKDGSTFPAEISQRRVRIGAHDYRLAFIRDVTERNRESEERRRLETQLERTQRLESLGILAGGVAHDFNNILMAILGRANLMRLELPADSAVRNDVLEIEHAAERAAELCRQMLTYAGKGRFVAEPIQLSQLVREMTALIEVSIPKRITLELNLTDELPALEGSATQLRQVVMNLVINAVEAIAGTGTIRVATGELDCTETYLRHDSPIEPPPPGRFVFVEVADSGAGMALETQARIFDPFFTTKATGRGLGLSTLLGIVRQHRGSLKLVSQLGRGTTFRVLLPIAPDARTAEPKAARVASPPIWRGSGTILLVDDEEGVREVGVAMLRWLGFQVITARDGVEGLESFQIHAATIACVILDSSMPRMGGREAFDRIRHIRPDAPVLFVSGNQEEAPDGPLASRCAYLQKPYQLHALSEALQGLLAGDRSV